MDETAEREPQHIATVDFVSGRYPYVPRCTCGAPFRGYVAEHAAQLLADAHAAEHAAHPSA